MTLFNPLMFPVAPPAHIKSYPLNIFNLSHLQICAKLCTDIHDPQIIYPNDFVGPKLYLLHHHEVDICGSE